MTRFIIFVCILFSGCAMHVPGYISRNDHPYERKINGSFAKVTGSIVYVLKQRGWKVDEESLPSIYERDERYDDNGFQNLLIITDTKTYGHFIYATFEHLNIFIHSIDGTCDVEVRYEARTPLLKQFISTRNDRLVNGLLNAIEAEVNK